MFALGFIVKLDHSGSNKDRPYVVCTVMPDCIPDTKALDRGFNVKNRGSHNILQLFEKRTRSLSRSGVNLRQLGHCTALGFTLATLGEQGDVGVTVAVR